MASFPPGWYKDPSDPARKRWWDGTQWGSDTLRKSDMQPWGIVGGLLLPILGLVIAMMQFNRGYTGPGMASLTASFVGIMGALALSSGL